MTRTEGKNVEIDADAESDGFLDICRCRSGEQIDGNLFIDCSGFRSLAPSSRQLDVGWEDWTIGCPAIARWLYPAKRR